MTDCGCPYDKRMPNESSSLACAVCVGCSERPGELHGIVGTAAGAARIATNEPPAKSGEGRRRGRWASEDAWTYQARPGTSLVRGNCRPDPGSAIHRAGETRLSV